MITAASYLEMVVVAGGEERGKVVLWGEPRKLGVRVGLLLSSSSCRMEALWLRMETWALSDLMVSSYSCHVKGGREGGEGEGGG